MFEAISQYLADTPHLQSLRRHPVPSSSRRRKKLHTSRTPTPDAFRWGRHHLGIRGRLFLGIGGRDHFGIRGQIASEFAAKTFDLRFSAASLPRPPRRSQRPTSCCRLAVKRENAAVSARFGI
ncbi:hypothetical protein GOA68_11380 [Sinorhizobium meliloti]|nr:hypothetical protein [Sinorhizobium meliloti]MDW9988850.1 hypothetical protein [Sinorhizobium meliloti]MDX0243361.1 hypothetical protein [Sinorhizobium meliloti]MDX0399196.1 hypothetical protein [Sinorhizobium meliloti]RVP01266.1 hypothetical protein CN083_31835 [Sinorhizobium meliloti]